MKVFKSHFVLSPQQRYGIFVLWALILGVLGFTSFYVPAKEVLVDQSKVAVFQARIDSLKAKKVKASVPKVFPFNPNFITDYKGYTLGMAPVEIDRLLRFRESGEWINSTPQFKEVTGVSDSLLATFSELFKFPDFITNPKTRKDNVFDSDRNAKAKSSALKADLNTANLPDFLATDGMTEELAVKILNYRKKIGGFLIEDQLFDIYGLPKATVFKLRDRFAVKTPPTIVKLNVNTATASDLATIPQLSFDLARAIVNYRQLHQGINDLDELLKIDGMNDYRLSRIKLYLSSNQD